MIPILFELVAGVPFPRLYWSGDQRQPDGVRLLTLEQTAERFGVSAELLAMGHAETWRPVLERAEAEEAAAGGQGGAGEAGPVVSPDGAWRVLRQMRYPEFSDEQLQVFLDFCRRHKIDPRSDQAYPMLRHNERTGLPEVVCALKFRAIQARALATGEYAGSDEPVFVYGDDPRIPVKASVTVYRLIGGQPRAWTRSALWDEYCPESGEGLFFSKPTTCLAVVAEVRALRAAFAGELGELYAAEELMSKPPGRDPRGGEPRGGGSAGRGGGEEAEARAAAPVEVEEPPETEMAFRLRLVSLGISNQRIGQMSEEFKALWPALYDRDRVAWYARVLEKVRRDPGAFGGERRAGG